jgi:predicted metalloprotease with PDZ domain
VAEGITTYMGDWMLWQSGVLNDDWWLDELSVHIQKHLDNEGRNHLSLADAAIDTWIDGYNRQPTPGRKVSIYTEGALLALVMDSWIMRCTNGRKHLAHFMKHFFRRYCHSGYTETQWWHAIQAFAPMPWHRLRADVIDGTGLLEAYLREALDFLGLEIAETPAAHPLEATWGLRLSPSGAGLLVQHVVPHGPAWQAGIPHYSHIVEINGAQALQSFGESLHHPTLTAQKVDVKLRSGFRTRMCTIVPSGATWTWNYTLHVAYQERFESWKQAVSMPKSHTEHG